MGWCKCGSLLEPPVFGRLVRTVDFKLGTAMSFFSLLAAGFLIFTAVMVLFFFFMGILQWRENRSKQQ